jgi:alpha-L-fucosidase
MNINGSETQKYHQTHYKNMNYYDFIKKFNENVKKWDPKVMAKFIHSTGAKYVVLTTKHHDG